MDNKYVIVCGQENADIENHFNNLEKEEDAKIFIFPERETFHQKTLFDKTEREFLEAINENKSIYVVTYSDHVFNSLRIALMKTENIGECHQLYSDNSFRVDKVSNGRLGYWVKDIFDIWDNALFDILDGMK